MQEDKNYKLRVQNNWPFTCYVSGILYTVYGLSLILGGDIKKKTLFVFDISTTARKNHKVF